MSWAVEGSLLLCRMHSMPYVRFAFSRRVIRHSDSRYRLDIMKTLATATRDLCRVDL